MAKPKPDPIQSRIQILDAAESMVGEKGFAGLTMRMLAEASGMSVGKIYKFFPDKASLFIHLELRSSLGLIAMVEQAMAESSKPDQQFRELLKAVYSYFSSRLGLVRISIDPPYIHSDFVGTELESTANEELAATMKSRQLVKGLVQKLLPENSKITSDELDQIVLLLINQLIGLVLNSHSRNFSYMLGVDELSQNAIDHVVTAQLDMIADLTLRLCRNQTINEQ